MKVRVVMQKRMTLDELATDNGLLMLVHERPNRLIESGLSRYFAGFESVEIKAGSVLVGAQGQGNTVIEAIEDYVKLIRGTTIVHKAYSNHRREIFVPDNLEEKFTQEDV